jgi:uncharacterized protein (TIGR03083 family)
VEPEELAGHLEREVARLAEAVRRGPLDAEVAACPGWRLRKLAVHVGLVHWWAAGVLATEGVEEPRDLPSAPRAPEGPGVADWLEEATTRLLGVLGSLAGRPEAPRWNWSGRDLRAGWWFRRLAHETAVHRFDAESAVGAPGPMDPELAVDGVDEFLEVALPRAAAGTPPTGLGGSLHLHATDRPGEWQVRLEQGVASVSRTHGRADAAVRGRAGDLELFVWNREVPGRLEVLGDPSVASRWRELVRL